MSSHEKKQDNLAIKYDQEKLKYHLLPADAIEELVKVYTAGAAKYSERNWENGFPYSRLYSAAQRHFKQWWHDGEELDSEIKCHHLAAVAFNILGLLAFELRGTGEDDRPFKQRVNKHLGPIVEAIKEELVNPTPVEWIDKHPLVDKIKEDIIEQVKSVNYTNPKCSCGHNLTDHREITIDGWRQSISSNMPNVCITMGCECKNMEVK